MIGGDSVVDLSFAGNIIRGRGKQHREPPHALLEMMMDGDDVRRVGAGSAPCEE